MGDGPIVHVPAPWKLKGTMYIVNFYCRPGNLPDYAYSPLEKESSFAGAESGKHVGGVGQFHFIRYTETPVGPYDELVIIPGNFQYDVEEDGRRKAKKNVRITRIYVSQKYTCWNGRRSEWFWEQICKNDIVPTDYAHRLEYTKAPGSLRMGGVTARADSCQGLPTRPSEQFIWRDTERQASFPGYI